METVSDSIKLYIEQQFRIAKEDAQKAANKARNEALAILGFVSVVLTLSAWFGIKQQTDLAFAGLQGEAEERVARIAGYEAEAKGSFDALADFKSLQDDLRSAAFDLPSDRIHVCRQPFDRECLALADGPCQERGFVGGFVAGTSMENRIFHAVCVK